MSFGAWLPVNDASALAPDMPGVLQARAAAILGYPQGHSAMLLYARSRPDETLRGYVVGRGAAGIGRAIAAGARWIRFALTAMPERDFDRLMLRFVGRFGAKPLGNQADTDDEEVRVSDG